jgi:hypothetical protein
MALHSRSRLLLHVVLPQALASELESASRCCGISPAEFCSQAVEGVLASRRLPRVTPAKYEPRLIHTGGVLPEDDAPIDGVLPEDDPAPLSGVLPEDGPPTLDDLAALEDIA